MARKNTQHQTPGTATGTATATSTAPPVRLPHSTPGHVERIEQAVTIALALPPTLVRRAGLPVEELLREARTVAAAAHTHLDALVERGLASSLADDLVARADALSQAQAMWLAERSRGLKPTASTVLLRDAEALRAEAIAILGLALRRSRDGRARLDGIGRGEGIADLLGDLPALADLARDADVALAEINEDAGALAARLEKALKVVQGAVARDSGSVVSSSKDARDRLSVLVEDAMDEVRAFAAVAFRNDAGNQRRGAFASLAVRRPGGV